MIIAVDFDGTIQVGKQLNHMLIDRLIREQRAGNTVILWSCREGKSLLDALQILRSCGFAPNFVNQNSPQGLKILGHDSRKIYADIYIDDKAVR